MTTDAELTRIVRSWLEDGRTRVPHHVLDSVLADLSTTAQRRSWWPARRIADVTPLARFVVAAAAVAVIALVGVNVLPAVRPDGPASPPLVPSPSVGASPSASTSPSPVPSAAGGGLLPRLPLPGTRASPAGAYGWEGGPASSGGLHKITGNGREVALIFKVGPDCLAERDGHEAVSVRVAGLDGVTIERYEPPVSFGRTTDDVTRAHALAVGDRTLCVFLTWHPSTTNDELAAAEAVLDTIRAMPIGEDRIRITFTLDEGWDVG